MRQVFWMTSVWNDMLSEWQVFRMTSVRTDICSEWQWFCYKIISREFFFLLQSIFQVFLKHPPSHKESIVMLGDQIRPWDVLEKSGQTDRQAHGHPQISIWIYKVLLVLVFQKMWSKSPIYLRYHQQKPSCKPHIVALCLCAAFMAESFSLRTFPYVSRNWVMSTLLSLNKHH